MHDGDRARKSDRGSGQRRFYARSDAATNYEQHTRPDQKKPSGPQEDSFSFATGRRSRSKEGAGVSGFLSCDPIVWSARAVGPARIHRWMARKGSVLGRPSSEKKSNPRRTRFNPPISKSRGIERFAFESSAIISRRPDRISKPLEICGVTARKGLNKTIEENNYANEENDDTANPPDKGARDSN